MSKKKKAQSSRISNDMYSRLSGQTDEEGRYKVKLGKSRKKLRKLQRKDSKRIKHEKKLEWLKKRKSKVKVELKEDSSPKNKKSIRSDDNVKLKSIYKSHTDNTSQEKSVKFEAEKKAPEDLELEYLEKQLLKNRKSSKGKRPDPLQELKSEFVKDGFDEDFLDFLSNITKIGDKEKVLDNDDLYEEDSTFVKHRTRGPNSEVQSEEYDDDDLSDDEDYLEEEGEDDEEDEDDDEEDENDNVDNDDSEGEVQEETQEEIEQELALGSMDAEDDLLKTIDDIKKKQVGLINKLSEGNYNIIVNQLHELYSDLISKGSKKGNSESLSDILNKLFEELCDLVIKMMINEVNVVISLIATQSALICSLANYFNTTILNIFLNKSFSLFTTHIELVCKKSGTSKEAIDTNKLISRNIIISLCSLFYFEVIDIDIIFHLIKLLTKDEPNEDTLQLLLILLKYSGYVISKNSDVIEYLNGIIEKYKKGRDVTNRMKYIEEELNSNKKSSNIFDQFEYLKNLINSKINTSRNIITLHSMLNYDKQDVHLENVTKRRDTEKDQLIDKAVKIGLNKDIQKTIFICIMNAISPENALNNILHIKLKSTQYNDVVNIIIYCYLIEKEYNYYYIKLLLLLTSRLNLNICKKYKRHINSNIILYFKNFHSITQSQTVLLSKLFYQMIINKISRLRLLNFINLSHYSSSAFKGFIKNLFGDIVCHVEDFDDQMEEYLIQELLSIKSENYFGHLVTLWKKHIEKYCRKMVQDAPSDILFKSYQLVFDS